MSATTLLDDAAKQAPRSLVEAAARALRGGEEPTRAAFLARAFNALAQLAAALDERTLGDAAGAPSDYAVVLRALEDPAALSMLAQTDPLAAARIRGLHERARIFDAEGGTLSADEVAAVLEISRQGVDKRRRAGRLIGLTRGRRGYAYPAWQFTEHGCLPGLEETLTALGDADSWMQATFFLTPNVRLGDEIPLNALRRGQREPVLRAARAYGEQGAA
ncbi:MAG TPA: hypothetical protein VNL16_12535 [Chloroflexota bacterium]|nr:hypothetical protein [Chloroflexota bacterium]